MTRVLLAKSARWLDYFLWKLFSPFKKAPPKHISSVLIVNQGYIGDTLVVTPLIKALSTRIPVIDMAVRPSMKEIFRNNPHVRTIYAFSTAAELKSQLTQYDVIIALYPHTKELHRLLAQHTSWIAGPSLNVFLESGGFSQSLKSPPWIVSRHKVEQHYFFAKALGVKHAPGALELSFSTQEKKKVDFFLKKNKIKDFFVMHPGKRTLAGKKYLWTHEKFAQTADYLIETYRLPVLICGSPEERHIAEQIKDLAKNKKSVYNAAGAFSIPEYGYLIKKAQALVSLDTSAVHLAAVSGTKTVGLYCCYPNVWYPWQNKRNYVLLLNRNVSEIPFTSVKNALDSLLKRT